MIYISHRGNINGKNEERENSPDYIREALTKGFDVEVDVWFNNGYWLGHKNPKFKIEKEFLLNNKIWCHAKDTETLYQLLKDGMHCFFHKSDKVTLTSRGYIWTYPNEKLTPKSIVVIPDTRLNGAGICSDEVERLK